MNTNEQPVIVDVNHVSMRFNLATEKTETLKETLVKRLQGKLTFNEFYALKDVSFQVRKGEAVASSAATVPARAPCSSASIRSCG